MSNDDFTGMTLAELEQAAAETDCNKTKKRIEERYVDILFGREET